MRPSPGWPYPSDGRRGRPLSRWREVRMTRSLKGFGGRQGLSPGTLASSGELEPEATRISLLCWNEGGYDSREGLEPGAIAANDPAWPVRWLRVRGFADLAAVESICTGFGIHPLRMEDALNSHDRPKSEIDDSSVFVSCHSVIPGSGDAAEYRHLALFLKPGMLVSLEEGDTPLFDAVVERMKRSGSRLRRFEADYLLYALMDAVVDGYFATLERMADRIGELEADIFEGDGSGILERIHGLRNEMLMFRRCVWPMRELVANLTRAGDSVFSSGTAPYLRDLYDHSIQVIETSGTLNEMLSSMLDTYLSSTSNRMNEVMKVLTIIATIFMPLTFLAGIYGMNFEHMPELGKTWAYPAVLAAMVAIGFGMALWFKRRGWL